MSEATGAQASEREEPTLEETRTAIDVLFAAPMSHVHTLVAEAHEELEVARAMHTVLSHVKKVQQAATPPAPRDPPDPEGVT